MDQLKPLDDIFLDLESPDIQANIGGVSVFKGPPPQYDEIAAHIESRLDASPRYRQRLRFLPLRLGSPVWTDDPQFDIDRHLFEHEIASPGHDEQLSEYYAQIVADHLDLDRPPWEIHIVSGLTRGRWAICWKVHHAMVDGLAAVDLFALLLDTEKQSKAKPPSDWTPQPVPSGLGLVARTLVSRDGPAKPLFDIASAARHPRRSVRQGMTAALAVAPIARSLISPHHSPLNGPVGSRRRWVTTRYDLTTVKRIGKAHNATVNDVLLAACANGLRRLLVERGEQFDDQDARTMVPVSIRGKGGRDEPENEISAVFIDLPITAEDPVDQLASVSAQMNDLKKRHGAAALEALLELARYVPPPAFRAAEGLAWSATGAQRLMNTVTTNVPGPQIPFYCLGREMLALYPYVLLPKNLRVTIAIFSYNGGVFFGVTGDWQTMPDVDLVARGIEQALDELA